MEPRVKNKINPEKKHTFFVYDAQKSSYLYWNNKQPLYVDQPPVNVPYLTTLRYKQVSIEDSLFNACDFFIQEGLRSKWFSVLEQSSQHIRLQSGALFFASQAGEKGDFVFSTQKGEYTLLRWKHNQTRYPNQLTQVDYFSFVQQVAQIEAFQQEPYHEELSMVDAMQGVFLCLEDKGIACIQMVGQTFMYVSYVGLLPTYRKTGQSSILLEGLFAIANQLKKDIVVAVVAPKLIDVYKRHHFFICGYWQES